MSATRERTEATTVVKATLLGVQSTEWLSTLGRSPHDFYHLPRYVAVSAKQEGGEPRALLVEDAGHSLLLPLVIRPIDQGGLDAVSPYGYPGPVVGGSPGLGFQRDALLAGMRKLDDEGVVSVFVRLHPILNTELPEGVGSLVRHGDTVCIDLTLPEAEQWRQTRRNHRQQIRQAIEAGYVVAVGKDVHRYADFKRLYRATMERLSAESYYHFDDAYFDDLRGALGESLHVATASIDGSVAAAGLFVETEGIIQMHLTGHDDQFSRDQPMKLVFHAVRAWAIERGNPFLHLGGGRGGTEDSLFHFKAGFSQIRRAYHSLRVVTKEAEYRKLVSARSPALDPSDMDGPFPLYRRA